MAMSEARRTTASPDTSVAISAQLALQDRLDDLLTGFEFWRDRKVSSMELTTLDEVLVRWVEHNEGEAWDGGRTAPIDIRRLAHLEEFVRFCAVGKRPDGTYNYGREAIEQRARELLHD